MKTSYVLILFFGCVAAVILLFHGTTHAQEQGQKVQQRQTSISVLVGPAIHSLIAEQQPRVNLRKLVTTERIAREHPNLAKYYRNKADQEDKSAKNYLRTARAFGDRVPLGGDSHFAGNPTACRYHAMANDSVAAARVSALLAALNEQARQKEGCFSCHSFHGHGGTIAPDLSVEGTRKRSDAWLMAHFKDPRSVSPNSVMPSFDALTKRQLELLSAFLQYQK